MSITFSDEDLPLSLNPFHDALVIEVVINGWGFSRILIDTGDDVNVMFRFLVEHLGVPHGNIHPPRGELVGFAGERREPDGVVTLNVVFGDLSNHVSSPVEFVILDASSAYNAIFGRHLIDEFDGVSSTKHLALKMPGSRGVILVRGI